MKLFFIVFIMCTQSLLAQRAPFKIVTEEFCIENDLSNLIVANQDDSIGTFGVLDTILLNRLQIHFSNVNRNKSNNRLYNVQGESRINKKVRLFQGIITIDTIKLFDRNYWFSKDTCDAPVAGCPDSVYINFEKFKKQQFHPKYLEFKASFAFYEDKLKSKSGMFIGDLLFGLSLDSTSKLIEDISYFDGIFAQNFQYRGIYKKYKSNKSYSVYWTDFYNNYLDDPLDGRHAYNPTLGKRGWKCDEANELIDNPKLWWKK